MAKNKKRKPRRSQEEEYNVGLLSSMRGGFKKMAAGERGPRSKWQKAWDILFWALIAAIAAFALAKRFR